MGKLLQILNKAYQMLIFLLSMYSICLVFYKVLFALGVLKLIIIKVQVYSVTKLGLSKGLYLYFCFIYKFILCRVPYVTVRSPL